MPDREKSVEENLKLTIEQVEQKIRDVYLLVDVGIIRIILATIIGNRLGLSDQPIWLLLISGSGSGKTMVINLISKCGPWIVPIDTLTTNTFASSLKRDEETSLLFKAQNGILVFKDFTGVMNMNEEGLRDIMGQLRNIFDGEFTKRSGNGNDVMWTGKVGIIAGGTIASQRKMRQFSEQGERFINYIINLADSKDMARRALLNRKNSKKTAEELADMVAEFVNQKISKGLNKNLTVPQRIEEEMIHVADFATRARSPVTMSKKDPTQVEFVGDREIPTRVAIMLSNIAVALMVLSDEEELSDFNAQILFKTAMDSIPVERRIVLALLAEYKHATTKALAHKLNYPTATVRAWCNQLNALKMIDRISSEGKGNADSWVLKPDYKEVMIKYQRIEEQDKELDEGESNYEIENAYVNAKSTDDADDELLEKAKFVLDDEFPTDPKTGQLI